MGTHHRVPPSSRSQNCLLLGEIPQIFSLSRVTQRWPGFPHNLGLQGCGRKAENTGIQWGLRDWPAGTHSTDSTIYSETLSAPPRSHSKLLSEPAGPAPWTSITVKAPLGACLPCASSQPGSRFALVLWVWGLPCLLCSWMDIVVAYFLTDSLGHDVSLDPTPQPSLSFFICKEMRHKCPRSRWLLEGEAAYRR